MRYLKRIRIETFLVVGVWMLLGVATESRSAAGGNPAAFVYNSIADLLAGDLWDAATAEDALRDLSTAPADWPVMGVGTTALTARNGEVFVLGTVASPQFLWVDPDYPQPVRMLTDKPLPFLAVAYGDPATAIVAAAEPLQSLHTQVQALAEAHGLVFAGVRVSGRFRNVSHSVAYNLEKQGTPLTDPTADKGRYQLFFDSREDAEWEFSGFYAATEELQSLVSVVGAPVHLHGAQTDLLRGGHLGTALVESAAIRLYPQPLPVRRECDLTVTDLQVDGEAVSFQVANAGANTVTHLSVQGFVGEERVFQIRLSSLAASESRAVTLNLDCPAITNGLRVIVDPYGEVLEADEQNNVTALKVASSE